VPSITPQKPSKNPGTSGIPEPFSKNPSPNPQEQQGTHQIERREGVTKRARLPRRSWVEKGEHAREGRWDCDEKRASLGGGVGRALFCLCVDVTVAAGRERGSGQASAWTLMGQALTEMPLPRARICAGALSVPPGRRRCGGHHSSSSRSAA
jgi:hypothetical protein